MASKHPTSRVRGDAAEEMAAAFLRLSGCRILERNVHIGGGEIDLVARRGAWLYLVEVRCRTGTRYGHPIESISQRKRRALIRCARAYIAGRGWGSRCWRFDAVTVLRAPDGSVCIRHFPDLLRM
jgi:putative endonuclease